MELHNPVIDESVLLNKLLYGTLISHCWPKIKEAFDTGNQYNNKQSRNIFYDMCQGKNILFVKQLITLEDNEIKWIS